MSVNPETTAKVTGHLLDAIAAVLADGPETERWFPTKAVMVYEFTRDDGSVGLNVFASQGMWSAESIGFLVMGQDILLRDSNDDDDDE